MSDEINTDDYFALPPPGRDVDEATVEIFAKYAMPRLGGASGKGWSRVSTLQKCPYLFNIRYVAPKDENVPSARTSGSLVTGSVYHSFLALGYMGLMVRDLPLTPMKLRDELLGAGVDAECVSEAWRLYFAYCANYENDYLQPLAVEQLAKDDSDETSCRYDLIAMVKDHPWGIPDGIYNVEHKTAARFDSATLDGWFSDGEILGQMRLWTRVGFDQKYGPLHGAIVNLVSKTKIPKFERIVVPYSAFQIRQHSADLKSMDSLEEIYRSTGVWPRFRASCVGRYGKCELFEHCANPDEP
jgi:hypothetical protein